MMNPRPVSNFSNVHHLNASFATFNQVHTQINNPVYVVESDGYKGADQRLFAALQPAKPEEYLHTCFDGTRKTILNDIMRWTKDFKAPNILLLMGSPGCGKSTIAATVVAKLYKAGRLGSNFRFKYNDPILSDPARVWPTIAFNLAKYNLKYKNLLLEELNTADPGLKEIGFLFNRLILDPLPQAYPATFPCLPAKPYPVVVIDAFDECSNSDPIKARAFQQTLEKWSTLSSKFKLIITGRHGPELWLEPLRRVAYSIEVPVGNSALEANEDIRLFLRHELTECSREYSSLASDWPGNDVVSKLSDRAAGLFIWASTAVQLIRKSGTPDQQVKLVLEDDKHSGDIGWLYARIIRDVLLVGNHDERSQTLVTFRQVLEVLLASKRPLHRQELHFFLSKASAASETQVHQDMSETRVDKILTGLASVIFQINGYLHVCHLSLINFLCESKQCPQDYHIDLATARHNMTRMCFQIMKERLRFNICRLESSHCYNAGVKDLSDKIQKYIGGPLSYACQFWGEHVKDETLLSRTQPEFLEDSGTMTDLDFFMLERFFYWLEVLSLLNKISSGHNALHQATLLIHKYGTANYSTLFDLITDASRFLSAFHEPISASAPHIYLSTWPWTPQSSCIRHWYLSETQMHHYMSAVHKNDQLWPPLLRTLVSADPIRAMQISHDGTKVYAGLKTGNLSVYSTITGEMTNLISGHSRAIHAIECSPDGTKFASGSIDKTICIWDSETYQKLASTAKEQGHSVVCLAFSPDGEKLVSGSDEETICQWDVKTGQRLIEPIGLPQGGHTQMVNCIAYSPDGSAFASASFDGRVSLWDAKTGQKLRASLKKHTAQVLSAAYSPNGSKLVSGSRDQTVRVWNPKTGKEVLEPLKGHTTEILSTVFSPDGKRILSSSSAGIVCIWDAETGQRLFKPFDKHQTLVRSMAFSMDRKTIVSASDDQRITIWDVQSMEVPEDPTLRVHTEEVKSLAFSPDSEMFATGCLDKTICVWEATTGQKLSGPMTGHTRSVLCVAFSPDGKKIVSGSSDETICVWDRSTGQMLLPPFEGHEDEVRSVAYSPDGKRIVSGSTNRRVYVWNAETGESILGPLQTYNSVVRLVMFSPDGKRIIAGSLGETFSIWDLETGNRLPSSKNSITTSVFAAAFSPDGKQLLTGLKDKSMCLWDPETGKQLPPKFSKDHSDTVTCVAFSRDGKKIASGSRDKTIRVWDAATGQSLLPPLKGHVHSVLSVDFSEDGKRIFSTSSDARVHIWCAETGLRLVDPLAGHCRSDETLSCAISPDGRKVACSSTDGAVYIWLQDSWNNSPAGSGEAKIKITKRGDTSREDYYSACNMDYKTGWVKTPDGTGLLFWVPPEHRKTLCGTDTHLIIGKPMTKVLLNNFVHGTDWEKCWKDSA